MKKLILFFVLMLGFVSASFAQTGDVSTSMDYDSMIATFAGFAGCVVLLTEGIKALLTAIVCRTSNHKVAYRRRSEELPLCATSICRGEGHVKLAQGVVPFLFAVKRRLHQRQPFAEHTHECLVLFPFVFPAFQWRRSG